MKPIKFPELEQLERVIAAFGDRVDVAPARGDGHDGPVNRMGDAAEKLWLLVPLRKMHQRGRYDGCDE